MADLVTRLRATQDDWPAALTALEREAADRIEELEDDRVDKAEAWDAIAAKNARVEELEAAAFWAAAEIGHKRATRGPHGRVFKGVIDDALDQGESENG